MKKYLILLTFIVLSTTSCAHVGGRKFSDVHPKIAEKVNNYKELLKLKGVKDSDMTFDLTAGFGPIGKNSSTVGVCRRLGPNKVEIEIDEMYWPFVSMDTQDALIYHELTHCLCGRDHNYKNITYPEARDGVRMPNPNWNERQRSKHGYFKDGCPKSLMHPRLPSEYCLEVYMNYYWDEMFDGCSLIPSKTNKKKAQNKSKNKRK